MATLQGSGGGGATLTSKGDLGTHDGTQGIRQAVGANGRVLAALSTETNGLEWGLAPAPIARGGAGNWHTSYMRPMPATTLSAVALSPNWIGKISAWPDFAPEDMTINGLAVLVSSATASTGGRVALYADNGSYYPGALLIQSAEFSSATTGFKSDTTVSQAIKRGTLFWRVLWWTTGATLRGADASDHTAFLGHPGSTSSDPGMALESVSAFTLGSSSFAVTHPTFPAGATLVAGRTGVPGVFTQKA